MRSDVGLLARDVVDRARCWLERTPEMDASVLRVLDRGDDFVWEFVSRQAEILTRCGGGSRAVSQLATPARQQLRRICLAVYQTGVGFAGLVEGRRRAWATVALPHGSGVYPSHLMLVLSPVARKPWMRDDPAIARFIRSESPAVH